MASTNDYAVIKTGGKQQRVSVGDKICIELLGSEPGQSEPGQEVKFDQVLALRTDGSLQVGSPNISGACVKGTVIRNGRGEKLNAFKKLRRKGMTKKIGHRQNFVEVSIDSLN